VLGEELFGVASAVKLVEEFYAEKSNRGTQDIEDHIHHFKMPCLGKELKRFSKDGEACRETKVTQD
jgi:hypothetical protein